MRKTILAALTVFFARAGKITTDRDDDLSWA